MLRAMNLGEQILMAVRLRTVAIVTEALRSLLNLPRLCADHSIFDQLRHTTARNSRNRKP